jgi:hypothetical protein
MSLSLALGLSLAASPIAQASEDCISGFTLNGEACEKTYSYSDGISFLTVPKGLGNMELEVYGAAAGSGGLDGGRCQRASGGRAGFLLLEYADLSGKTVFIYPGDRGKDGASGASNSGGGLGGASTLRDSFNGGRGGNAGSIGSSGGGGGGGAATVVDIDQQRFVAAGAGAGGGCANSANGSTAGSILPKYTQNSDGGNGTSTTGNPYGDGGGGGGGGGGILGGLGGLLYKAEGNESAGYGGHAGSNTPAGERVALSEYEPTSTSGKVLVRYFPILGAKSLEVIGSNPTSANVIEYKLTLRSSREFDARDVMLSGSALQAMRITITSPKPVKAPYVYYFNVTPRDSKSRLHGVLVAKVFDVSAVPVTIDANGPEAQISLVNSTLNQPVKTFDVTFNESVLGISKNSFRPLAGTATGCLVGSLTGEGSRYQVTLTNCSAGTFGLSLNQNSVIDASGNAGPRANNESPLYGQVVETDDVAPEATVLLKAGSLKTNMHLFDVRFDELVTGLTSASFKPAEGTSKRCQVGDVVGRGKLYLVSLENCTDGTFGLTLLSESAQDAAGNKGPYNDISSSLQEQITKATTVTTSPGEFPQALEPNPISRFFSELDAETQNAIKDAGIYAASPGAPSVTVVTDLANSTTDEQIQLTSSQQIEVGSSVRLSLNASPEIADVSDVVAFMETGELWQYLGRASFTGTTVNSGDFTIAKPGDYKIRLVIIGKDVATNMSLPKVAGFGKGLGNFSRAVNAEETALSPQQIDITLTGIAGPNGLPEVVEEPVPEEPVTELPGVQTDENAPSKPYDPLGSPEAIAATAEAVGTAVVVAGAVAGAVAAAAGGGGGGGARASSESSGSESQNTDSSEGEISTLDSEVESFTTTKVSWGDQIPIFKLKALTFLDVFTHNLTVGLSKYSPVVSKVVNDGAYLRAIFGSMWLALPITGVVLAAVALLQPSVELKPPSWEIFLAIAILGMFDAFSGMVATLIYSVGMFVMYGIQDLSDIRLMMGVLLLGFGPVLIGVAFRAIRKHFETNFAYLWDRLVDLAVLTFFISWAVSSMVATLPALGGRTLVVANFATEFSIALAITIAIRILLEELAARGFSKRLDTINPTEVPSTSQVQKVISTILRLFIFVFVTAAFMGNVWQVWVGSFIFILPNILSWFQDRFPNFPVLWRVLPQGVPALALTLIVSSFSAGVISGWLEGNPEYPQYLFMLLPIPVFLIGLLGMFGREGNEGEERPIMNPKLRWVYRIGGIGMLVWTMSLAGVI